MNINITKELFKQLSLLNYELNGGWEGLSRFGPYLDKQRGAGRVTHCLSPPRSCH